MRTARPYLAPELTLGELAAQMRTNTSWLSRVINTGCGQNFNDFINEYRVREAEHKLRDPRLRHYTLLAVALESGFNSKSTFNRVFRKLRGVTPSEAARLNP
jgi:AraC-like DNA-binding protein